MATPSVTQPQATPTTPTPSPIEQAAADLNAARQASPAITEITVTNPGTGYVAAPAEPQPFETVDLGDGKLQVKFQTGEIFTGTQQELLTELAKSKVNGNSYIHQLKTQKTELEQQVDRFRAAIAPPAPQPKPIDPAASVILDLIAPALGFENGDALKGSLSGMYQTSQQSEAQMIAGQFMASNPDFLNLPENNQALTDFIESNGLDYSPMHLSLAHNYLKNSGTYKHAAAMNATVVARPTPPPTIPSSFTAPGGSPITEEAANNMPLADLGKLVQSMRRGQ